MPYPMKKKKKKENNMTVTELIKALQRIKDKSLLINCIVEDSNGSVPNNWVVAIEEHATGNSGYEIEGEVSLITEQ